MYVMDLTSANNDRRARMSFLTDRFTKPCGVKHLTQEDAIPNVNEDN